MMRLIDADSFKMEDFHHCLDCDSILQVIKQKTTIDAEPIRHAHWIENDNPHGYNWHFKCSNCGYVDGYPFEERYKYCPSCGAEMNEKNKKIAICKREIK